MTSKKAGDRTAQRAIFLDVLRSTANVSRAARAAGLPTSSLYRQRAQSQAFAADWDAAISEASDTVEEELTRRARDGVEKPVFYGGKQIGTMRIHSNDLLMFLAKSRRPEIYNRGAAAGAQPVHEMTEADGRVTTAGCRRVSWRRSRPITAGRGWGGRSWTAS